MLINRAPTYTMRNIISERDWTEMRAATSIYFVLLRGGQTGLGKNRSISLGKNVSSRKLILARDTMYYFPPPSRLTTEEVSYSDTLGNGQKVSL